MNPHVPLDAAAGTLVARIGHTPLLELRLAKRAAPGLRLFATLECGNPGVSI